MDALGAWYRRQPRHSLGLVKAEHVALVSARVARRLQTWLRDEPAHAAWAAALDAEAAARAWALQLKDTLQVRNALCSFAHVDIDRVLHNGTGAFRLRCDGRPRFLNTFAAAATVALHVSPDPFPMRATLWQAAEGAQTLDDALGRLYARRILKNPMPRPQGPCLDTVELATSRWRTPAEAQVAVHGSPWTIAALVAFAPGIYDVMAGAQLLRYDMPHAVTVRPDGVLRVEVYAAQPGQSGERRREALRWWTQERHRPLVGPVAATTLHDLRAASAQEVMEALVPAAAPADAAAAAARPAALRDGVQLTAEQRTTQAFMARLEAPDASFLASLGTWQDLPDGRHRLLVTPYLPLPLHAVPRDAAARALQGFAGGIVANCTGTGKTLNCLYRCLATPGRSVIVVPDVLLLHWASEVRKHTRCTVWEDAEHRNAQPRARRWRERGVPSAWDVVVLHRTRDLGAFEEAWTTARLPRVLLVSHSVARGAKFRQRVVPHCEWERLLVEEAHHALNGVLFQVLQSLRRRVTWAVTATPYGQHHKVLRLLQVPDMLEAAGLPYDAASLWPAVCAHATVRTRMPPSTLRVEVVKEYCAASAEETRFLHDVGALLEQAVLSRRVLRLHRFFRILERLGAGGRVNRALILRVLKHLVHPPQPSWAAPAGAVSAAPTAGDAPRVAFMDADDECQVCLCPYLEPVQTGCGHVFCQTCLQGMLDLRGIRCPACRTALTLPFYRPRWRGGKRARDDGVDPDATPPEKKQKSEAVPDAGASSTYRAALRPADDTVAAADTVTLQSKAQAFAAALAAWAARRQPGDQLVVFGKEQGPSLTFAALVEAAGLTHVAAGLLGTRKLASVANIEAFRRGEADVLLISNRYCDGFDLFMAHEVWLLNTDLAAYRMEQAQGRVQRIGQRADTVTVRVFVYRRGFDEFLWDVRTRLQSKNYDRRVLAQFYLYAGLTTRAAHLMAAVHHVTDRADAATARSDPCDPDRVRVHAHLTVDVSTGWIVANGRPVRPDELLLLPSWQAQSLIPQGS